MRSLLSPAHARLRRLIAAAAAAGIVLLGSAGVAQAASGPAFTAHADPASNQFGSMVPEVLSASGLPADATGTVNFTDLYDTFLCSSPVTNGATSGCNYYLGYQAGGMYTITAAYSGDSTYAASSATTTYTVTPAPSTFTAAASSASEVYGNPVTLSESGFPSYASGSIKFQDTATGAVLCTIANIQATQSCQTDGTQHTGTENVTAFYSGDNDFQPSTATTGYTITKASISPTFTVTPDPSTYGQTLTFTESGFPAAATGTITYTGFYAGEVFCTETLPATSCQTTNPVDVNTKNPVLNYPGDNNYNPVTYRGSQFTVNRAPSPNFAATATPNPTPYGTGPETLAFSGVGSDSTGTVTFTDHATGALLCAATIGGATGSCTSTTPSTQPVGAYQVDVAYSGDASYLSATTTTTYDVTTAPTTFTVTEMPDPATYGQAVTITETGLPATATGTLTYTDHATGATLCVATLPDPTCATDGTQGGGPVVVDGAYLGDTRYAPSTSFSKYTVSPAGTALQVSASPATGPHGTHVTLAQTKLPANATGTVTFTDQTGAPLCTITLPAASCDTNGTQPAAQYSVTAQYSGDDNYQGSTANTQFEVTPASFTPSVTITPNPTDYASPVTFDSTGVPADATGTIDYTVDGSLLCTATLPTTSCATDGTRAPGAYSVVATYNGDDSYTASTSAATAYAVNRAPAPFTAAAATNPSDHATPVDLIDLGLPSGSGSDPAASGTITYTDTTTGLVLCTTTLPATTCSTDGTQPSGRQDVTAAYSGDAFYAASRTAFSYTVKLATTMRVAVTPSPATPKQAVVLHAAGLPTDATGTVTFGYSLVGGQYGDVFCSAPLPSMTCSATAPTQAGAYAVTGIFSGDAKYSSVSTTTTLTVAAAGTAVVPKNPGSGGRLVAGAGAQPTSAAAAPRDGTSGAGAPLAFTGADLAPGILGILLLTGGAVLRWATRRRETRRTS